MGCQLSEIIYKPIEIVESIDPKTLENIRELVYEKSGIKLDRSKESLIRARIGKRMRSMGVSDHREYLKMVIEDNSGQEIIHLLNAISTNVTSFFRGIDHFEFLAKLMEEWVSDGQIRFRIWSAACSSGEEPYSMGMSILHTVNNSIDCKILATDISTGVLQKAQEGIYNSEKVNHIPKLLKNKYLEKIDGSEDAVYKVKNFLKDIIVFRRLNLSKTPFPMRGPMDVVFCRNVMIYFDINTRKQLIHEIYRLLKPHGYLFVGHAESLIGLATGFRAIRPSVYIKE